MQVVINVLFVYPPLDVHTKYWHPHLGLGYLCAVLAERGCEVDVVDMVAQDFSLSDLCSHLRERKPYDVVCVTATTTEIEAAHGVASCVKREYPESTVVVGGPHPTALPRETLQQFPFFDVACVGEGEDTLAELVQALKAKKSLEQVKGIAFRDCADVVLTGRREYVDLDLLPFPDWSRFPLESYTGFHGLDDSLELPVSSGRGCPHRCVFCQRALGSRVRLRCVKSVVDEVERNISLGAKSIYFCDETFTLDRQRTLALLEEMNRRNIGDRISWHCETRADSVDEELLEKMREAGCKWSHSESNPDRIRCLKNQRRG